ncbi:MAG: signal peptidase I [Clostridia bacterium]|nr:signal peptidase I [Clostridia bacterium]
MNNSDTILQIPNANQMRGELRRLRKREAVHKRIGHVVAILLTAAAVTVLFAMLYLPMLMVVGESMTPSLSEGEIVVSLKGSKFQKGDVVAFNFNNQILVKRVIADAGEWVDIDEDGNVYVNNVLLKEPYVTEKAFGNTDITLPYQVPDGQIFVMGDHRATSADSRSTSIGCISRPQIVGRILWRIWPFNRIGIIR